MCTLRFILIVGVATATALILTSGAGVGGIAEMPDIAELPLETTESPARDYTPYIVGAAFAGAVIVIATGAWYAMRCRQ